VHLSHPSCTTIKKLLRSHRTGDLSSGPLHGVYNWIACSLAFCESDAKLFWALHPVRKLPTCQHAVGETQADSANLPACSLPS
jgi:hypothetical protein